MPTDPITVKVDVSGFENLAKAFDDLSTSARVRVVHRALNKAGDRAFTKAKRTIAKTLGLKQRTVGARMSKRRAGRGGDDYHVIARGGRLPLSEYKPRQTKKGVTARIYNKRILHAGAFIVPRYGGKAYRRQGKARFPLEQIRGPSVTVEMLREPTAATFGEIAGQVLVPEMVRLMKLEIDKVKSRYGL